MFSSITLIELNGSMWSTFILKDITHKVNITHPGIGNSETLEYALVEVEEENKETYFYMDVESVVCGSKECRVDIVRLFWDELGQFLKLEMQNDAELEKNEGILFTSDDYLKLDNILKDVNSPLQNFYKDELVNNSHANAADAYSGATVVIDNNAIVEGAVWTCYTLWHWANGDVVKHIINISAKKYTKEKILELLMSSAVEYRTFALEQCIKNKWLDTKTINAVINLPFNSKKEIQSVLLYIENINVNHYYVSINKLYNIYNNDEKVLLLNALLNTKQPLSQSFLERFSTHLLKEEAYQNIDLILRLFSRKKTHSLQIHSNVLRLLENKDFLISRNAYYFLKNQNLDANSIMKMTQYEEKHKSKI
ncbi:hypothetical protein GCM10022291_25820 [Postechiella marina]|uniref:Uncharacterized protein n=1 Tax=Postechiella marina TaxID=943941 RepID=A0ABP8CD52_9FLAO